MVAPLIIGAGIAAGSSLLGGAMNSAANKKAQQGQNEQAWYIDDWNRAQLQRNRDEDYARQKEFANMGVRWKVNDAQNAGIHPLAVLGGGAATYSPGTQSVGMSAPSASGDSSWGNAIADAGKSIGAAMGQDTSRAQQATATVYERQMADLNIRNMELRNAGLELQNAQAVKDLFGAYNQPVNPAMPAAVGPTPSPLVTVEPSKTSASGPLRHVEAAPTVGFKDVETAAGRLRLPTESTMEIMEGMGVPGGGAWLTGINALAEWWNGMNTTQPPLPGGGVSWRWDPWTRSYHPQLNTRRGR